MSSFLLAACLAMAAHADNPLLQRLLAVGVQAGTDSPSAGHLPTPSMPDGLEAAGQLDAIQRVAPPSRRVEDLLRNAVVAPFVLKTQQIAAGGDPLWQVDVWYVAYGSLDSFCQESFVQQLLDLSSGDRRKGLPVSDTVLTAGELQARGVTLAEQQHRKETYRASTIALFDRVLLSTTRQVMISRSDESVVVAAAVDPRFSGDSKYPNQWRPITRRPDGSFELGEPQPYTMSAMYLKVTRLKQPANALFIEHHQLFAEPQGWFDGKNFLRSKLPLAVQDSVRSLRRQLAKPAQ